ncbi:MAG: Dolichyl-phosphate-mannose-protein mannosyltransferase [Acidimicrobiales bacterium]|nr:Dolichyl-phosphate-mannose-protein mannosyltransferase [Acidimicrobiales bacterium]
MADIGNTASPPKSLRDAGDERTTGEGLGPWRIPVILAVAGVLAVGIILRFLTRSPLWLDEALSVNISRLPLGQIGGALRHDGHPPLYYYLLHLWMDLFGSSNGAVRAFSGLWAVALLPLTWLAGQRLGGKRVAWAATLVMAASPFAIRYGTETRMYSMVMVLALSGWLVAQDALRRPTLVRLAGLAVLTGALLLTHYWAMWFLAAVGVGLLVRLVRERRAGDHDATVPTLKVLGAMAVGGLLFLPWLPSLLYQGAHTGTPWAKPLRPTDMVVRSLADFGGGVQPEAIMLGWVLAFVALLGVFGRAIDKRHIELDLASRPEARPHALLVVLTLSIAAVAGYATNSTYASRYAAVFFPFFVLLVGLGLARFESRRVLIGATAMVLLFGLVGGARNVVYDRSQSVVSARAIAAAGRPGDWIVYCPDQLGPATSRVLERGFQQVTYPEFAPPARVDWRDYTARLARQSPDRFADELVRRAAGKRIFLVWSDTYTTHRQICPDLVNALLRRRPGQSISQGDTANFYEPAGVYRFDPAPGPVRAKAP